MSKTTVEFDEQTTALIYDLKLTLGVKTKVAVLECALKIAGTLAKAEADGAKLYIKEPNEAMAKLVIIY